MAKKRKPKVVSRYERFRRKYPEVHGKVVDFIDHGIEDGTLHFTVRFKDKTSFSVRYRCGMIAVGVELCDLRTGDLKVIREYMRAKSKV